MVGANENLWEDLIPQKVQKDYNSEGLNQSFPVYNC